jgi:hypothetical protein
MIYRHMSLVASGLGKSPAFLITIDAEGDNLWAKPRAITTRNSRYLPRFQALCERYGLKPTYLTNWEMVNCPDFREFAKSARSRSAAEVGMHLHAWNSPPISPLTDDDFSHQPYLIEYPKSQIHEKVKAMTDTLEDAFGVKMVSHRAGRWALDGIYAQALLDHGYRVDCSVTPHVSWRGSLGDPRGVGGADYSGFPEFAYFFSPSEIGRPVNADGDGRATLLELPMTVIQPSLSSAARVAHRLLNCAGNVGRRLSRRIFLEGPIWLRPRGSQRSGPLRALRQAWREGRDYVELMLHSSELMPGGSPRFPDDRSIELLYEDLHELFSWAAAHGYQGSTLAEYDKHIRTSRMARQESR